MFWLGYSLTLGNVVNFKTTTSVIIQIKSSFESFEVKRKKVAIWGLKIDKNLRTDQKSWIKYRKDFLYLPKIFS